MNQPPEYPEYPGIHSTGPNDETVAHVPQAPHWPPQAAQAAQASHAAQAQQPPSGKRGLWRRFRGRSKKAQIGIGCGALFLTCSMCAGLAGAVGGATGATNTANTTSTTATSTVAPVATHRSTQVAQVKPTATSTPKPTATTSSQSPASSAAMNATVLGGNGSAFVSAYGPLTTQSDQGSGDLHFKQYPGVAEDALIVDLGIHYGVTPGDQQAFSIVAAPAPSSSWSVSQAQTTCTAYSPSDAQKVKSQPISGSPGVEDVYQSASLAKVFPASAFVDTNQNPVTPGTFSIQYLYPSASATNQIVSCEVMVGS